MNSDKAAHTQDSPRPPLEASDVETFLSEHPAFFKHRPELLTALELPHGGPGAVSLVERQVTLLRERNIDMRNRLASMTETAQLNDALFNGTRETVLALLDAQQGSELAAMINHAFTEYFDVEMVGLIWLPEAAGIENLDMANAERAATVAGLIKHQQSFAGVFRAEEMRALFDSAQDEGSAALAPIIVGDDVVGVLAVGSSDVRRYDSTVGTLFLDYIASVIARLPVVRG